MSNEETLIQFPCHFPIKIIGEHHPDFIQEIIEITKRHYPEVDESTFKIRPSAKATFVSITVTIYAQDKKTLDALYLSLTQHPKIKMVL